MCIIAIKPQGMPLQDETTLRGMFARNPHGAGFMFPQNGRVEIRKGFMTYDAFRGALRNVLNALGEDTPIVMHFRITTHGGTCPENTHPFPLTNDIAELKRTSTHADIGVAHNGIIRITPRDKSVSDTQEYIASVLAGVARKNPRFYRTARIRNGIRDTINGSRMCFMNGTGDIVRIGDWIESDGYWYSNDSFRANRVTYTPAPQTRFTYTDSVRLPWERDARLFVNLTVLSSDDVVVTEHGERISGRWFAIDRSRRVYMIDIDDAVAIETDAHCVTDARYDRTKAVCFELAS